MPRSRLSRRCWCLSRSTPPIPIASRRGSTSPRAISSPCRSGPARRRASSGRCARRASGGNLKAIAARRDLPRLDEKLLRFVDWIARYTLAPRGMVLRMVARVPDADEIETPRIGVRLAATPRDGEPLRITPARARVLKAAEGGLAFRKSALAEAAACSSGVIDGLIDEGALETVSLPRRTRGFAARHRLFDTASRSGAGRGRRVSFAPPWRAAASRRRCSKASPDRARPKSISRRSRRRWRPAGRC